MGRSPFTISSRFLLSGTLVALMLGGSLGLVATHNSSSLVAGASPLGAAIGSLADGAAPMAGRAVQCVSAGPGSAQCAAPRSGLQPAPTWVNVSSSGDPTARNLASMTWDAADGYVVLFGGCGQPCGLNDTWVYQNGTWTHLFPANHPAAREDAAMAYDPQALVGAVLLFGGLNRSGFLQDTWKFAAGVWVQVHTGAAGAPPGRFGASMAWDQADDTMLLFGGGGFYQGRTLLNDTWTFNGFVWTRASSSAAPQARLHAMMSYDAGEGYVLLFGGQLTTGVARDTWKFAGGNWTNLHPLVSPPGRQGGSLVYDTALNLTLLFGGLGRYGFTGDTWSYSGGRWLNLTATVLATPSSRAYASGAYADHGLKNNSSGVVLFGGWMLSHQYRETWAFGVNITVAPAAFRGTNAAAVPGESVPLWPLAFFGPMSGLAVAGRVYLSRSPAQWSSSRASGRDP